MKIQVKLKTKERQPKNSRQEYKELRKLKRNENQLKKLS